MNDKMQVEGIKEAQALTLPTDFSELTRDENIFQTRFHSCHCNFESKGK